MRSHKENDALGIIRRAIRLICLWFNAGRGPAGIHAMGSYGEPFRRIRQIRNAITGQAEGNHMATSSVIDHFVDDALLLERSAAERPNINESRLRLLHKALTVTEPGRILSLGLGSGISEAGLRDRYGITIAKGVEPSQGFAELARAKGFDVDIAGAQDFDYKPDSFDTILYNGSSFGFIPDDELEETWRKNYEALSSNGKLVFTDVPKESALGAVLFLAQKYPQISDDDIEDILAGSIFAHADRDQYKNHWHVTEWYIDLLRRIGFREFRFFQTVLANPTHQEDTVEDPIEGYDKGNYIAVVALK